MTEEEMIERYGRVLIFGGSTPGVHGPSQEFWMTNPPKNCCTGCGQVWPHDIEDIDERN